MRSPVVKTSDSFLQSNMLLIGLPLLIIFAFCSTYIGVKAHTASLAAASRQGRGTNQRGNLPAITTPQAHSLPVVSDPGSTAPKNGMDAIQPANTPQKANARDTTSNMNVTNTPNNPKLTEPSNAQSTVDSNNSSAPTPAKPYVPKHH